MVGEHRDDVGRDVGLVGNEAEGGDRRLARRVGSAGAGAGGLVAVAGGRFGDDGIEAGVEDGEGAEAGGMVGGVP